MPFSSKTVFSYYQKKHNPPSVRKLRKCSLYPHTTFFSGILPANQRTPQIHKIWLDGKATLIPYGISTYVDFIESGLGLFLGLLIKSSNC